MPVKQKRSARRTGPALTHVSSEGDVRMVDITAKGISARLAVARGRIRLLPATLALVSRNRIAKGNVLATARIAGIQAAKETSRLIPLCHPLNPTGIEVDFRIGRRWIDITCTARITGQTGVEMEALVGVSAAALAIYDMCKAVDKQMEIGPIALVKKTKTPIKTPS